MMMMMMMMMCVQMISTGLGQTIQKSRRIASGLGKRKKGATKSLEPLRIVLFPAMFALRLINKFAPTRK